MVASVGTGGLRLRSRENPWALAQPNSCRLAVGSRCKARGHKSTSLWHFTALDPSGWTRRKWVHTSELYLRFPVKVFNDVLMELLQVAGFKLTHTETTNGVYNICPRTLQASRLDRVCQLVAIICLAFFGFVCVLDRTAHSRWAARRPALSAATRMMSSSTLVAMTLFSCVWA